MEGAIGPRLRSPIGLEWSDMIWNIDEEDYLTFGEKCGRSQALHWHLKRDCFALLSAKHSGELISEI